MDKPLQMKIYKYNTLNEILKSYINHNFGTNIYYYQSFFSLLKNCFNNCICYLLKKGTLCPWSWSINKGFKNYVDNPKDLKSI